jgi:hypothetical protein
MAQLNIVVTPQFERDLQRLMKLRRIPTKSDAIRFAVHELASRGSKPDGTLFSELLGAGLRAPLNSELKFKSEDDLWS